MPTNPMIEFSENNDAELRQRRLSHLTAATLRGLDRGLAVAGNSDEQRLAFAIEEARTQFQSRMQALLSDAGELQWLCVGDDEMFGIVVAFKTGDRRRPQWGHTQTVTYQQQ